MFGYVGLPHTVSFVQNPGLFWLEALSDALIALAFFLIAVVLVRRRRGRAADPLKSAFYCFAAIVLACGMTYAMDVVALWRPIYGVVGVLKAGTAATALTAFLLLLRLKPDIAVIALHEDMAKANRQMASVLESTTICVMAVDNAWRVNYVNGNARNLLKVQGEMLGMTLWEAFPVDQPANRELLLKVMETRQPASYEKYYQPLNLTATVQAHPWDNGGVAIFFSDISAQKKMQHDLDWERVMREQRLEILARFSAGIAHEMKNPLAIIHARASDLAEMAEEGDTPPEDVARTCASIVKTSDRALRILRGLAALAREGSNDPMQKADVGEMVKQAIELVQARYRTRDSPRSPCARRSACGRLPRSPDWPGADEPPEQRIRRRRRLTGQRALGPGGGFARNSIRRRARLPSHQCDRRRPGVVGRGKGTPHGDLLYD